MTELHRCGAEGGQDIVGFETRFDQHGNVHAGDEFVNQRKLRREIFGRCVAGGFVFGIGVMTKGFFADVESDTLPVRGFFADQTTQHFRKPHHGVGWNSGARR